jgi:hypothetical protein
MRLTKTEDSAGRLKASQNRIRGRRRRRGARVGRLAQRQTLPETSSDDEDAGGSNDDDDDYDHVHSKILSNPAYHLSRMDADRLSNKSAMEKELIELEDAQIRRTNAYPGATNTIGSVHQRRWYISMDRVASGLVKRKRPVDGGRGLWQVKGKEVEQSWGQEDTKTTRALNEYSGREKNWRLTYPFYVLGPDIERSIITGRRGEDILRDEGVTGFVRRLGWKAVSR